MHFDVGGALTPLAKDFYEDDGYIIVEDAVSPEDCDAILEIYNRHADEDYATIMNLDREVPDIQERVMKHPFIVDLVESLTASPMVGCQTFFLFKKPGTRYANQEWNPHQDNSYPRAEDGAYLAVDIALADQDEDSGGIFLWPGTHHLGLLPFEEVTGYREAADTKPGNKVIMPRGAVLQDSGLPEPCGERQVLFDKVNVTLRKGQVMVFDGNLIHGSYANKSDHWRPAIITNYLKKDAEMIEGRTAHRMRIPLR